MHRSIIKLFAQAISNDIYIDSLENKRFCTKDILGFEIIKPSLFIDKLRSNNVLKYTLRGIMFLWLPVGFVFILFKLVHSLLIYSSNRRRKVSQNDILMLMFSHRLVELKKQLDVTSESTVDIYFKKNDLSKGEFAIFELTNLKSIFQSFLLAVRFHFTFVCDRSVQLYQKMNSIFCFDWFIVYTTLQKQSFKKIVFCNHYDRWAVLFDNLYCEKELVQHGLLSKEVFPPVKLNTISALYAYNSYEAAIFENNVLATLPEIKYLNPNIILTDFDLSAGKPSILFISCLPITFNSEVKLLKGLNGYDFVCFVKPHPVYSNKEYIKLLESLKFHLLVGKNDFPKVDLVVSYKSTLAYEYELCGIDVVYYDSFSTEEEMILEILNKLK